MSGLTGVDFMSKHNAHMSLQQRKVRKLINGALRKQTRGDIVAATKQLVDQLHVMERAFTLAVRRVQLITETHLNDDVDETTLADEFIEEALTQ